MERLTKRSDATIHENGVCCVHFMSEECCKRHGDCAAGCPWEEAAWSRLADYEDTALTPGEIKSMQGEHFSALEMAKLHSALMELKKYQEAEQSGRVVVLPCKVGELWRDQDTGRVVKITDVRYGMKWEDDTSVTYDYSDGSHGGALWDAFHGRFMQIDTEK